MNWPHLLSRIREMHYTEFLSESTSLLVLILFFMKRHKRGVYIYLVIMAAASLFQYLAIEYDDLMSGKSIFGKHVSQNTLYLYLIIEFTCCLSFIRAYIKSTPVRKILLVSNMFFIVYAGLRWIENPTSTNYFLQIPAIEGFLIIIACLYFFYELIIRDIGNKLIDSPVWIIAGMLILSSIDTPVFLLLNYFYKNSKPLLHNLYTLNNLAYSFLFIVISIAIIRDKIPKKMSSNYVESL